MVRRMRRRRGSGSNGKEAWLWLATTASWFIGACVTWLIVDLSLGVFEYDYSDTMTAWFVTAYLGPVVLVVVAANFALAQRVTGLPRWARITALAVALLVALPSAAAFLLLVVR